MGDIANIVTKATKALESAFGKEFILEGDGTYKFLDLKSLSKYWSQAVETYKAYGP